MYPRTIIDSLPAVPNRDQLTHKDLHAHFSTGQSILLSGSGRDKKYGYQSLQAMSSFMHFPICATYCTLSLEDELVQRMEIGIPVFGMPLRIYQKRGVYGRQFVLRNGRLDILGIDTAGDLYVIELKKDSGYDDAYAQTREYIDWIEEDVAVKGQRVFGIICLNDPTKDLIEKVKADDQMRLFEYSISYSEII